MRMEASTRTHIESRTFDMEAWLFACLFRSFRHLHRPREEGSEKESIRLLTISFYSCRGKPRQKTGSGEGDTVKDKVRADVTFPLLLCVHHKQQSWHAASEKTYLRPAPIVLDRARLVGP